MEALSVFGFAFDVLLKINEFVCLRCVVEALSF